MMKCRVLTLTVLALLYGSALAAGGDVLEGRSSSESKGQFDGLYALIQRRVPQYWDSFQFVLKPSTSNDTVDTFTLSDAHVGSQTKIQVECSSISACARGLYTYLTELCNVDIYWTSSRLHEAPPTAPPLGPNTTLTRTSLVKYRYHFNTVTFSYTTAFWTFSQWSLLLDWLALHGVNLPLAWVGNEYIVREVLRGVGLTDDDLADFFTGPAFQSWNRLGNIQGSWGTGGPLPSQWINDQFALQKQIVKRMVELGMTPALPSFTGFVPRAMHTRFPNASIVNGSQWGGVFTPSLTHVSFLEPFDPLFTTLQRAFISEQQAAYGEDVSHVYTLDQYNENEPLSGDVSYLANVSANTFASLRAADEKAVWLMQGWLFFADSAFWTPDRVQAYLDGVPDPEGLIILDLYSEAQPQWERLDNYFGKQWVWCLLHDYGATVGMEGNLVNATGGVVSAKGVAGGGMVGVGLTMEGMEGNEVLYNAVLTQTWSPTPLNISSYITNWVTWRYTSPAIPPSHLPQSAYEAWSTLASSVYANPNPTIQSTPKSLLELPPSLSGLLNRTGQIFGTLIPYNTNTTLLPALLALVAARESEPELSDVEEFRYDIVDIARQLLANRFIDSYEGLVGVWNRTESTGGDITRSGGALLEIITTLDELLLTNEHFLLANWLSNATSWSNSNSSLSSNDSYASYLEFNARNQITLWGPNGEINDYASKQWGGLVGTYYLQRWTAFVDYLADIKDGDGVGVYNETLIQGRLLAIGEAWDVQRWGEREGEVWGTRGNVWEVVGRVLQRWG